jgi:magnesium chelatase family protein
MEDGTVEIVRVAGHVRYPASFTLIAAINPCPCGYLGHPRRECKCTERQIAKYRHRISGPILDRIDLTVMVAPVEVEKLSITKKHTDRSLTSKEAKAAVVRARRIQTKRFAGTPLYTNSQMRNREVKQYCHLTAEAENFLKLAAGKYDFSARSYMRLIKVARTIADLADNKTILPVHMAEALQYKQLV